MLVTYRLPNRQTDRVEFAAEEHVPDQVLLCDPAGPIPCERLFVVRLVSLRTGSVCWIDSRGTPVDHRTEAGGYTRAEGEAVFASLRDTIKNTTGRFMWTHKLIGFDVK